MKGDKIHIVSFDVPYPADYGGAIDVFYKLNALKNAGAKIILHCFEYGRSHQSELNQVCTEVFYYPRTTGVKGVSLSMPYIVSSRKNATLAGNLINTNAPILFEGIHTTALLNHPDLKARFKAVRVHNVEHDYYRQLAMREPVFLRKAYFNIESLQLRRYEHRLQNAAAFFSLSQADAGYFEATYPTAKNMFVPAFHSEETLLCEPGTGTYCLYHGNLSHPENIEAVKFLLTMIAPKAAMPLVIAGRNPHSTLIELCAKTQNCRLVANPDAVEMDGLVANAHIHLLPTWQRSGVKLKLIKSLFRGRHIVANDTMLHGTGLSYVCTIANTAETWLAAIESLKSLPFTAENIAERRSKLLLYDNASNAQKLLGALP